jgi:hypothetical protein
MFLLKICEVMTIKFPRWTKGLVFMFNAVDLKSHLRACSLLELCEIRENLAAQWPSRLFKVEVDVAVTVVMTAGVASPPLFFTPLNFDELVIKTYPQIPESSIRRYPKLCVGSFSGLGVNLLYADGTSRAGSVARMKAYHTSIERADKGSHVRYFPFI